MDDEAHPFDVVAIEVSSAHPKRRHIIRYSEFLESAVGEPSDFAGMYPHDLVGSYDDQDLPKARVNEPLWDRNDSSVRALWSILVICVTLAQACRCRTPLKWISQPERFSLLALRTRHDLCSHPPN